MLIEQGFPVNSRETVECSYQKNLRDNEPPTRVKKSRLKRVNLQAPSCRRPAHNEEGIADGSANEERQRNAPEWKPSAGVGAAVATRSAAMVADQPSAASEPNGR